MRKNRNSLHGSQVTMPHDIDGGGGNNANLKSALRRRSKYEEELSIGEDEEEHQVEESVSDDSYSETDHEEIELTEEVQPGEQNGDFVDWDDVNDPEYIAVNTTNAYIGNDAVDDDGGKGDH